MTEPVHRGATTDDLPPTVRGRPGDLRLFYAGAFGLTWGTAAVLILARPQVEALTGEFDTGHPLFFLAVYAPTITAVALTAVRQGRPGLRDLARRTLRWRVHPKWYAVVLGGWLAMDYAARGLQWVVEGEPVDPALFNATPIELTADNWWLAPALLAATLVFDPGPLGEEVGQRAFALPRVLARRTPLVASLEVGAVWGVWHVPAFFIAGTNQHDLALGLGWLVVGCTVQSVLMTAVQLHARGSALLGGILPHLMINVSVSEVWALSVVATAVAVPVGVYLHRSATVRRLVGRDDTSRRPAHRRPARTPRG